jgi:hypothetical protein
MEHEERAMAVTITRRKSASASEEHLNATVRNAVEDLERLSSVDPQALEGALRHAVSGQRWNSVARVAKTLMNIFESGRAAQRSTVKIVGLESRARAARKRLAAARKVLPAGDIITQLNISRQALSKAVKAHRLFAVEAGGERLYPAFFADADLDRRQLERVAKELGELPGWQKWEFFMTPKASLGGLTPVEALKRGRYTETRRAAIGFLER